MSQNYLAIFYLCIGMILASVADAFSKLLAQQGIPVFEMLFFFGLSGTICSVIYGLVSGGRNAFKSNHYKWHALRGSSFVLSGALNIFALSRLQIDQFYVFGFTNAFWIVIVGYILLKDNVGWHRFGAIFVGFITIIFMLRPDLNIDMIGAGAALLSAFIQAFAFIPVRFMPHNESKPLFALSRMFFTLIFATPFMAYNFVMPSFFQTSLMLGIGALYVVIMVFLSLGYLRASTSSVVAPFHYTQMIWGIILGALIFNDTPTIDTLIGASVLILTGIYIIRHEHKQRS